MSTDGLRLQTSCGTALNVVCPSVVPFQTAGGGIQVPVVSILAMALGQNRLVACVVESKGGAQFASIARNGAARRAEAYRHEDLQKTLSNTYKGPHESGALKNIDHPAPP